MVEELHLLLDNIERFYDNKLEIKQNQLAIQQADDIVSSINKHRLTQIIEQCEVFEESSDYC